MEAVWHGTQAEHGQLLLAIDVNCPGEHDKKQCAAHMLLNEQRVMDGLLFARRIADQLRHREFEA